MSVPKIVEIRCAIYQGLSKLRDGCTRIITWMSNIKDVSISNGATLSFLFICTYVAMLNDVIND